MTKQPRCAQTGIVNDMNASFRQKFWMDRGSQAGKRPAEKKSFEERVYGGAETVGGVDDRK